MFTALEAQVRALGRLVLLGVLVLVVLVAAADAAMHRKAGPAPCVTASGAPCHFTPHPPRSAP